jgi:hypothetical protein
MIVTIVYHGDQGELDNQFLVEELSEIQGIIERGPDWNTLDRIEIRLNPRRRSYSITVDEAAQCSKGTRRDRQP